MPCKGKSDIVHGRIPCYIYIYIYFFLILQMVCRLYTIEYLMHTIYDV